MVGRSEKQSEQLFPQHSHDFIVVGDSMDAEEHASTHTDLHEVALLCFFRTYGTLKGVGCAKLIGKFGSTKMGPMQLST